MIKYIWLILEKQNPTGLVRRTMTFQVGKVSNTVFPALICREIKTIFFGTYSLTSLIYRTDIYCTDIMTKTICIVRLS